MRRIGYLAAGLGMLRVPLIRDRWKQIMVVATSASIILLLLTRDLFGSLGAVIDVLLLVLVMAWAQPRVDADVSVADAVGAAGLGHPWLHRTAWSVGALLLVYAAIVVAVRPVYVRWGTTALNVFVFEPAHFIMERGMMRGVRDRAEAAAQRSGLVAPAN